MLEAGVPCVPGVNSPLQGGTERRALRLPRAIGFIPVIIKATDGGGGRGMRVVHSEGALANALALTPEPKPKRRLTATKSIWRNICKNRVILNFRY